MAWAEQEARAEQEDVRVATSGIDRGRDAWQLLTRLLDVQSVSRPSAAEALLSPYLNADCADGEVP